jgi:hypothetical protein
MKIASNGRPNGYSGTIVAAGVSRTAINDQLESGENDHVMVTGEDAGLSLPAPTQKTKPSVIDPEFHR